MSGIFTKEIRFPYINKDNLTKKIDFRKLKGKSIFSKSFQEQYHLFSHADVYADKFGIIEKIDVTLKRPLGKVRMRGEFIPRRYLSPKFWQTIIQAYANASAQDKKTIKLELIELTEILSCFEEPSYVLQNVMAYVFKVYIVPVRSVTTHVIPKDRRFNLTTGLTFGMGPCASVPLAECLVPKYFR